MSLHPGETGFCPRPGHGTYDEFCGKCADLRRTGACMRCEHAAHAPGKCDQRVMDGAGDMDDCGCLGGTLALRCHGEVTGRFSSRQPNRGNTPQAEKPVKLKWILHGQYAHVAGAFCHYCNARNRSFSTDHLPEGSH